MSYSSFSNCVLLPGRLIASGSDVDRAHAEINSTQRNFGSLTTLRIPKDDVHDILDFIFFLENHAVKLIPMSDIQKDDPQGMGRQGSSMEVFAGTWKAKRVALKYLRQSRLPDPSWKTSNGPEYMRRLKLHQQRQKDILFEIKIMARDFFLNHRNIVNLFGVFFEEDDGLPGEPNIFSPGMVLELADEHCPDLEAYFAYEHRPKPIPFDTAARIISDVADGVTALHLYGVIHADLKPSNILIFESSVRDKPIAKIADFGFCGIIASDENTRGGTSYWNAPEVLAGEVQPSNAPYTTDPSNFYRDIYSFGLVAATTALDGNLPFDEQYATQLKLEDKVITHISKLLETNANALQYTEDQVSKFIRVVRLTLCRSKRDRLPNVSEIRLLLLPETIELVDKAAIANLVPFSLMESAAHNENNRYARGWQYPTRITQYDYLPASIVRKLDEVAHGVDLETAPPPVVAQCFFWAQARMDYIGDRLQFQAMSRMVTGAAAKMKEHAQTNKPDFAAVNRAIKQEAHHGLQSDLERLLSKGILESPVLRHIRLGDLKAAQQCLENDPSIARMSIGAGWGCLHYAAHYDRVAIINQLIWHGLDINEPAGTNLDSTPLAVAARRGNLNSVRTLLQLGAAVDPPFTGMYRVPLREAIMFSDDSKRYVDTVSALLEAGANTGHGGYGTTPLHNATHLPETMRLLIKHAPEAVKYKDLAKATPLHHAVRRRSKKVVLILLSSGADVNAEDENGFTPLHVACRMFAKGPLPFHSPELEKEVESFAIGTLADGRDIIAILREAGADIDASLFQGTWGPQLTPDSFLYDIEYDITEITVPFLEFSPNKRDEQSLTGLPVSNQKRFDFVCLQVGEILAAPLSSNTSILTAAVVDKTAVMIPTKGSFEYEYIFQNVLPNNYEFVACIGRIDGEHYKLPQSVSFRIYAEDGVPVVMGGYMRPMSRICPTDECVYIVKFQEFDVYACRNLRLVATFFTEGRNQPDQKIGGLLLKWIRIQRANTDVNEFTQLSQTRLSAQDLAAAKDILSQAQV